ncbi:hypothetical protein B0I00_0742 [Novosphingobium kunmingense]|uniref:Uncharacterized protein n=1 Tax=Novosphingobium kunmingense TaxID=1211806 RepID=A0A2N0I312_9SPHN|nr:hypothetical protein [Novosphingobium kunmingense]PKB25540.1 hypothetical protein B0I00_0742 [Novosphingobium kunmingense]
MIASDVPAVPPPSAEDLLRDELAVGDAQLGTYAPILRHLLASDEHSVFSDEIIARVRGMMADLARQVVEDMAASTEDDMLRSHDPVAIGALVARFAGHEGLLKHCHALALEWHLTQTLQGRLALDPVLSPLLQALIASSETTTASQAMALLAAQARFAQTQRRMQLPLAELPGDLLFAVLVALRAYGAEDPQRSDACARAESAIRARFDEGRSRLGLMSRLLTGMGAGLTAALSVSHAGAGLFLSALAMATGQDRDHVVMTTSEGQYARLYLSLRAAGLKPHVVEEQFMALFPDVTLPDDFDQLGADRAAALLAGAGHYAGY